MAITLPRVSVPTLEIRPIRPAAAHIIQTWRYHGVMERYNIPTNDETHQRMCQHDGGYWQVRDEQGALHGFIIIGKRAQIDAGDYPASAVDILIGLRPDLIGRLHGSALCHVAVTHARTLHPERTLRVSIPTTHVAALAVWQRAGFFPEYAFMSQDEVPFVVLTNIY